MAEVTLYDNDILLWSEQQAEVIRRLGQTRRDLPNDFDVENVAEEIESVGRSEMASVESFLRLALVHLIKITAVPDSAAVLHWREEAVNFRIEAVTRLSPAMMRRVDTDKAWRLARVQAHSSLSAHGDPVPALPEACPFSVEELVGGPMEIDSLLARLAASAQVQDATQLEDGKADANG